MTRSARTLDPFEDRAGTKAIWRALATSAVPSYFLSWSWIENWLATLPRQRVSLRLVVIEDDGTPIAACFVGRRLLRRAGVIVSRALFLNETGHEGFDEILIEHNGWLVLSPHRVTLAELIDHLPRGWDELFLHGVDARTLGDERPRSPSRLQVQRVASCHVIDLARVRDASGDYLSLVPSQTRSQIRRSLRLYEARGALAVDVAKTVPEARAMFEELVKLHESTWSRRDQSGAFARPYLMTFHERLIRERLAHGEIQLLRIRAGDRTIGCLYNFLWNGTVSFYQCGFVYEDDNRLKPGLVCHALAIQHNASAGAAIYDLLGGDSRYKQSLATGATDLVWARVQKPRPQFFAEEKLRTLRAHVQRLRESVVADLTSLSGG